MKTDVAIIGGGPGGSAAAMFLSQTGLRVTMIEKAQSPRYHIGESLTGECGNCLRALGLEEEMTARRHPVKYGVTVYGPRGKNAFWVPVKGWHPESGLFDTHTWSVRRSDFDHMLFTEAATRGVSVMQGDAVAPLLNSDAVCGVRVRTKSGTVEDIASEVVVDASGQATFLSSAGLIGEKVRGNYDRQVAIFSQVAGAIRDPGAAGGNTLIFYRKKNHWAWFIPLDDQVVSVGLVVPANYYRAKNESKHQFLLRELHELNAELRRRLPQIEFVEEVRGISNYSYRIKNFTGKGFLCVGDSHRFIDPIFSFGVFFAMKEAEYAAASIASFYTGRRCARSQRRSAGLIWTLLKKIISEPAFERVLFITAARELEGIVSLVKHVPRIDWIASQLKDWKGQPLFALDKPHIEAVEYRRTGEEVSMLKSITSLANNLSPSALGKMFKNILIRQAGSSPLALERTIRHLRNALVHNVPVELTTDKPLENLLDDGGETDADIRTSSKQTRTVWLNKPIALASLVALIDRIDSLRSDSKREALTALLGRLDIQNKHVAIYCTSRATASYVHSVIAQFGKMTWLLTADRGSDQIGRILNAFQTEGGILVTTSAALTGVDLRYVQAFIHYDPPRSEAEMHLRLTRSWAAKNYILVDTSGVWPKEWRAAENVAKFFSMR